MHQNCESCITQGISCQDKAGDDRNMTVSCLTSAQQCYHDNNFQHHTRPLFSWKVDGECHSIRDICVYTDNIDSDLCDKQFAACQGCQDAYGDCFNYNMYRFKYASDPEYHKKDCREAYDSCFANAITLNGSHNETPSSTFASRDETITPERRYFAAHHRYEKFDCTVPYGQLKIDNKTFEDIKSTCLDCAHQLAACAHAAKSHHDRISCVASAQLCNYRTYTIPQELYSLGYMCQWLEQRCVDWRREMRGSICDEQQARCLVCPSCPGAERDACVGAVMTLNGTRQQQQPQPLLTRGARGVGSPFPYACDADYDECLESHDKTDCDFFLDKCYDCLLDRSACLASSEKRSKGKLRPGYHNDTEFASCTVQAQICFSAVMANNYPRTTPLSPDMICKDAVNYGRANFHPVIPNVIQDNACADCVAHIGRRGPDDKAWNECFKNAMTLNGTYAVQDPQDYRDDIQNGQTKQLHARTVTTQDDPTHDCAWYKARCENAVSSGLDIPITCADQQKACSICKNRGNDTSKESFTVCMRELFGLTQQPPVDVSALVILNIDTPDFVNCTILLETCNLLSSNSTRCIPFYDQCLQCQSAGTNRSLDCIVRSSPSSNAEIATRELALPSCNCTDTNNCSSSTPNHCPADCLDNHALIERASSSGHCCVHHREGENVDCSSCHDTVHNVYRRMAGHCCSNPSGDYAPPPHLTERYEYNNEKLDDKETVDREADDRAPIDRDSPVTPRKFHPTSKSLDNFVPVSRTNMEEDLDLTVDCVLVAKTCISSPFTDTRDCQAMIDKCYRCAYFEFDDLQDDRGNHSAIDVALSSIAAAQLCYNAAFSEGTTLNPDSNLGYSCERAKRTCEQKTISFNFQQNSYNESQHLDNQCQQQHDVCQRCQLQEKTCLVRTGDHESGLGKSSCSVEATSCFHDAMTFNGTYDLLRILKEDSSDEEERNYDSDDESGEDTTSSKSMISSITSAHVISTLSFTSLVRKSTTTSRPA